MASFFHIPSRYPDHVIYWKTLNNHLIRYRHYESREDYLENWSYYAANIIEDNSSLDLVPFFEDAVYPIQKFPYGFLKRFLEIIPPNFVFDFVRTNKNIFDFFKNLRGIPTKFIQLQLQETDYQDLGISEENGEISFLINGDPYCFPNFVEIDFLKKLHISNFLHVEAEGYEDEAIVEILEDLPTVYPDFTYEGCEDLDLVLKLVHNKVRFFKLKATVESFDIDNFLRKISHVQSLFIEVETMDEFTTDFLMGRLQDWKHKVKDLKNFYLGLADETNFRRFYLIDEEIKCFEDELPGDFEFDQSDED